MGNICSNPRNEEQARGSNSQIQKRSPKSSYEENTGKLIDLGDEVDFHFNFKHKDIRFNVQFKDLLSANTNDEKFNIQIFSRHDRNDVDVQILLKDPAPTVIVGQRDFASLRKNSHPGNSPMHGIYSNRDMSEEEFLDFSDNGSDQFHDLPDMSCYYEDNVADPNLTPRDQFVPQGISRNDSGHKRQNSSANYKTAPNNQIAINDMGMEAPDESEIEKNPYIWSHTVAVGQRSFVDPRQKYQKLAPPPIYLDGQKLIDHFYLPTDFQGIIKGLETRESGMLVCTDQEMLEKQNGVMSDVVKQIAVNIWKGLGISHISMPAKIFEPKSSISRMCDLWTFAPKYLRAAADTNDSLERLKLVIAFAMSSVYLVCNQSKPFNPILGETNQGHFHDGTEYFCEHTSHHPPISNFLVEDVQGKYKLYGYYEICGKVVGATKNNFVLGLRGPNTIRFSDGQVIRFGFPNFKIGGLIYGERTIEPFGCQTFEDLTNNVKAVVNINTYKKGGYFGSDPTGFKDEYEGVIFHTKSQLSGNMDTIKKNYGKDMDIFESLGPIKKEIKDEICRMEGRFLSHCIIDNQKYWDINDNPPTRQIPNTDERTLASDWRFREDLLWLSFKEVLIAHQWKVRIEVQQRHDRKNRNDAIARRKKQNKK